MLLRALKRLYNLGIYPEWWKLPPPAARRMAGDRRADRRARSVLPRCRAAGAQRADRRARARVRRRRGEPHLPRIRRRAHDLPASRRARGSRARSTTRVSSPRVRRNFEALIDAWTARARMRRESKRTHEHDPPDDGAGAGPLPRGAAHGRSTGARCRCSPACGRSSGTATSPGWAKRSTGIARQLPTYRAHNEQAMAHAAIAYAKAHFRRRMMACTTSIGPGATNLITAAATAHVNRLPVLFLPGDIFVSRAPDPVLQQVEDFRRRRRLGQRLLPAGVALLRPHRRAGAAADRAAARDRRADRSRALRAGDARAAAGRAGAGVRLSRRRSSRRRCARARAALPDAIEVDAAAGALRAAKRPLVIAGGGVLYSEGGRDGARAASPKRTACRSPRRRPGRARCRGTIRCRPAPIGVTGGTAANALAHDGGCRASPSARGCRTSRPARTRCSRRRGSSRSTSTRSTRSSGARVRCSATRRATLDALSARLRRLGGERARGTTRRCAKPRAWRDTVSGDRRRARRRAAGAALRRRGDRRRAALASAIRRRTTSSSARRDRCRASCTSSGARRGPAPTTSSTATRAWATRSPAASASRWRARSAKSSCWSATAAT